MIVNGFDQLSSALGQDLGTLCRVERIRSKEPIIAEDLLGGEDLESFCLRFEHGLVIIHVAGENDTVSVSVDFGFREEFTRSKRRDISAHPPWNTAVGKCLWEVWALTNSLGYQDAIQLEFGAVGGGGKVRIQLEAVASTLHPYVVHRQV